MTLQFNSLGDFLAMGGYSFDVWLAYGLSFLAMGVLVWQSKRETKQILRLAKKEQQRESRLKQR
jgi:heme exporter protein D